MTRASAFRCGTIDDDTALAWTVALLTLALGRQAAVRHIALATEHLSRDVRAAETARVADCVTAFGLQENLQPSLESLAVKSTGLAPWITVTLTLALAGWTADAAVPPAFFSSPMGKEIERGNDAGDACGSALLIRKSAAAYDSCVTAAQDKNRQTGGDSRGFDAGLFFSVWQQMDGIARPDWAPDSEESKQLMAYSKPLAVKYLKLYREAQNKAGVTDEQVIVITRLNLDMFKAKLAAAEHGY